MGCTVREKHIRTNRRPRSVKPEFDPCCYLDKVSISKSILESGLKPLSYHLGLHDSTQNSNPNPNSTFEDHGWGYCTEEQLEEILLKNLEFLYNEAISKLVALGYDEDVALKAILKNGYCYGGMDVLTNILHNSLAYLNSSPCGGGGNGNAGNVNSEEPEMVFNDLRQLEEYSLAGMVCLLQQVRPHLSKGDAMWCLLMSDLHVGRANSIEIPGTNVCGGTVPNNVDNVVNNGGVSGVVAPALCRFHGGWGFGSGGNSEFSVNGFFSYSAEMTLPRDIECPKRFNLSPSMKSLLKRNVAMFAAGFRANSKQMQSQSPACLSVTSGGDVSPVGSGAEVLVEKCEESKSLKDPNGVDSVMSKLRDLNIDEHLEDVTEDQKDEMIVTLLDQVKELEKLVKERKEWAHQKAMQAARKLSNDLTELKMLRMEREETQRLKKGKQTLEDTTMKRLSEMENALRKASGQVDRANAAVRRLETENAEIRAEMEASKLSAAESVTTCLEVAKREKKCLKRLLAWEKQKAKLQEEIADEKEKIKELQRCLARVQLDQKETESKWRQEQKAKELALTQVEEEQRSKEAAEASNKRKLEALRLKIEIDFQRHKDDLQRLEQEFSRLKASAESTELIHQSATLPLGKSERVMPQGETIARLLHELDELEDSSEKESNRDRDCMICLKDEVSIVFLPCAHQVLCVSCSDNYGKKGKATCPCCRVPIEQRIRVFGASS
ncbi:MND1-interacting protein 1-like [Pistacia vera]|uniref:MND1-interacting protein 1-like n=1 Tax=Pistacia vera TaxID=55513 RepID=UPI0012639909|nr:MND1-interacting protein 1-like [Pistacia vera]XP_031288067.1 MND1-interacting protein 1-like [Pistacia vera]